MQFRRADMGDICGSTFSCGQIFNTLLPHFTQKRSSVDMPVVSGLQSGLPILDEMIDGFHPGELIVVAARPSMGARDFVWQIALHVAWELKQTVAYFSTNKSRFYSLQNLTAFAAKLDRHRLRGGKLSEDEWESLRTAAKELASATLLINDTSADPKVIRQEASMLCASVHAPSLIIVDEIPAQISTDSRVGNRLSRMAEDVFRVARDNRVPVIALASISRAVEECENKRPTLSDIDSADGLQWYADTVLSLYREDVYNPQSAQGNRTEVLILKSFYGCVGGFDFKHRE